MGRPGLKVLYISRGYTTHDRRFLASFVGAGWSPVHLPIIPEQLDHRGYPDGVATASWAATEWPSSRSEWRQRIGELSDIIDALGPDVVLAGPVQSGALMAALAGADPLVSVSWGSDVLVDADADSLCRHATSRALDASALAFGDCRAVREALKRHSALDDSDIITFPWGIDLGRFHPGADGGIRSSLGWENADVFLSTRTWERVYAIDVLIYAFAEVYRVRPESRLMLLGDGSLHDEVKGLIDSLKLQRVVHAPGRVGSEGIADYFRAADVYVSSALSDGTSVSLLEAMACGLPVVVSDSYGNLEWVEPGVNGELATPGDATSLARAMLAVVGGREGRVAMGVRNIEVAGERADWEMNFPELAAAVERVARA